MKLNKNKIKKLSHTIVKSICFHQVLRLQGEVRLLSVMGLHYITNAMYGATGVVIATISVMVVGLLCLGHFLKWTTLGYTIIGISIIFGAGSIVNGIASMIRPI